MISTKERDLFAQVVTELKPGATLAEHRLEGASQLIASWETPDGTTKRLAVESWAVRKTNHNQLTRILKRELQHI